MLHFSKQEIYIFGKGTCLSWQHLSQKLRKKVWESEKLKISGFLLLLLLLLLLLP
jgi:hypothetical protein